MTNYGDSLKKNDVIFQTINNQNGLINQASISKSINLFYQEFNRINLTQIANACSYAQKLIIPEIKLAAQTASTAISAINKSLSSFTPEFCRNINASIEFMKSVAIPTEEVSIAIKKLASQMQDVCLTATTALRIASEVTLNNEVADDTEFLIEHALPDGEKKIRALVKT